MNDNSWFKHCFIKGNLRIIHNIYITKILNCGNNNNNNNNDNNNNDNDNNNNNKIIIIMLIIIITITIIIPIIIMIRGYKVAVESER